MKERTDAAIAAFEANAVSERDETSTPSLTLDQYAGRYRDAWYGDIDITPEGDGLVIRFSRSPSLVGELIHWQHDTFLVQWFERELRADAFITFTLTPEGGIDHATMKPASPAVDFSYDFQDLFLEPAGPVPSGHPPSGEG